ncbi:hypothetical protein [Pseudolactococcus yaeyamensis]
MAKPSINNNMIEIKTTNEEIERVPISSPEDEAVVEVVSNSTQLPESEMSKEVVQSAETLSASDSVSSASVVSAEVVNRRGTTGSPLYHDGLPSENEVTSLTINSQRGNTTTYDYYFKNILSIPSYGRQAISVQTGQLIITLNDNNTATIQITGGIPQVTNTGTEQVAIENYTVGGTRTVNVNNGEMVQGLLVQQSFGQSPLGSIDNLAGDYYLVFS